MAHIWKELKRETESKIKMVGTKGETEVGLIGNEIKGMILAFKNMILCN